jgi:putative intracellular protease/amidase
MTARRRVLMPLPDNDFDTTEVSVPWRLLTRAGHEVVFATERGTKPACDPLLLTGVVFGQLGAEPEPKAFYEELERSAEFNAPIAWSALDPASFDGLYLPGGHAKGMRQYLEGKVLQEKVAAFWKLGRPVAAICHGTIVLARTRMFDKSVLFDRKTTCLPKFMERTAYLLTAWRRGSYYRTYPEYVEDEVKRQLADPARQFQRGPLNLTTKGTEADDTGAFVVEDANYLSARWPGDAYLLAKTFRARLEAT